MAKINYREQYAQYSRYFTKIIDTVNQRPIVKESVKLILSLLTISFLLIFALRPTINTILELLASIKIQKEVTTSLDNKLQSLNQARSIWSSQQEKILTAEQAITSEPKPDSLLQQVEGLVAKHNLSITGFSEEDIQITGVDKQEQRKTSQGKPDLPGTKGIKFSLSVDGPYKSLESFMQDLDNLRLELRIDTFSISQGKTGNFSLLSLRISGTYPYLLPDQK